MNQREKLQAIVKELLAAIALLPENILESDYGYSKEEFEFHLEKGELLLAMEELDGVVEDNPSPSKEFWIHLIRAAEIMGHAHKIRYEYILKSI